MAVEVLLEYSPSYRGVLKQVLFVKAFEISAQFGVLEALFHSDEAGPRPLALARHVGLLLLLVPM